MAFWQNLQSLFVDTNTLNIPETLPDPAETIEQIGNLVNGIKESQDIQVLISNTHINSLLDFLTSPLVTAIARAWTFDGIAKEILKSAKSEPDLQTSVLLVSQAAYLESFQQFFSLYSHYSDRLQDSSTSDKVAKQVEQLGAIEFTDKEAKETLVCFHDSPLAKKFNQVLQARLQESGLEETEAQRITERISRHTHRYIQEIVADLKDKVSNLVGSYSNDYWRNAEAYSSIDKYLTDVIAKKPLEKVFDEEFCFQDIYVPLEVRPVRNGEVDRRSPVENMETWAQKKLLDEKNQVLFIQGGPGRGKSVFCRMFADWVRQELHPIYTPILIRLRDLSNFAKDFDQTLATAVGWDFVKSDSGWLTDRNTRFLFLLDGFDELLLERGASTELKQFLEQVEGFQRRCNQNSERGHRVLITGRPLALYGIERVMPSNLARVEIVLMSQEIQRQWLDRWQGVVDGKKTIAEKKRLKFESAIQHKNCPKEVQNLAKEPLLLYLLAAMHRDGKFNLGMFESATAGNAKVLIYEAVVQWVLEKQRSDSGRNLNPKMTGLDPDDLRSVLAEAALCVVQFGGEHAPIKMIEARLEQREDLGAKEIIEQARRENRDDSLKNALAAFYLKSVTDKKNADNSVEFFHKSFGEFLCAERMVESFAEWTEKTGKRRKNYVVSTQELERQIYDLFGYGHLTPEIVEYIRALWKKDEFIDFIVLFERLNDFYLHWSDGEFIEATEDTLSQKKARNLKQYKIDIGQRQVDVYTGLNTLILLLELHRFSKKQEELKEKIDFHLCGYPDNPDDEEEFDYERFLRVIHYSDCFQAFTFRNKIAKYLRGANLSNADLSGANLSGANLISSNLSNAYLSNAYLYNADLSGANLFHANFRGADLSGANLRGANLSNADLSGANLSNADLISSNLSNANLYDADLSDTNLSDANLSNADLSNANFSEAYLSDANLSDVKWDNKTNWSNAIGLHEARGILEALQQEPNFAAALTLSRGESLAEEGKIDQAISAYKEVQEINPHLEISADFWNILCWHGCLQNRAADVLFAGQKAVEMESNNGNYLDTRGLARALTGNLEGAIEDFQAVLDSGYFDNWDSRKQQLQGWLEVLRRGENPITEEVLASLR